MSKRGKSAVKVEEVEEEVEFEEFRQTRSSKSMVDAYRELFVREGIPFVEFVTEGRSVIMRQDYYKKLNEAELKFYTVQNNFSKTGNFS